MFTMLFYTQVVMWFCERNRELRYYVTFLLMRLQTLSCGGWHQSIWNYATATARTCGSTWTPHGAAWHPLPEVLGNGPMEVSHGGAGGHGYHPGVLDSLVSHQAGNWVQKEQALDKVLGEIGNWGPRLREKNKEKHDKLDKGVRAFATPP